MGGVKPLDKNFESREFGKATPLKIGMWLFLGTDALSFSGFLIGYGALRAIHDWPNPMDHLGIALSSIATFILICSSVSLVLSIDACKHKQHNAMVGWLIVTILGGVTFLGIQAYEYVHLVHYGMGLSSFTKGNALFSTTFFLITGFHGFHVLSGVIYLMVMLYKAVNHEFSEGRYHTLEIAGLFWHFVDLVWILVFTFIYLL